MNRFVVSSCTFDDGSSIAKVVVPAFWTDPTWIAIWPGKSLEYVTAQNARRMPHVLLLDRANRRHQKVVDTDTDAVVGYARWTLPQLDNVSLGTLWPTAQVPGVTLDQELDAEAEYEAADYAFDRSLDELDEPLNEIMSRLMSQKRYVGQHIYA